MRKQLVSGKKLLLFVDTGDNCRCPLAIGYLTKLLSQKKIDYIDLKHMGVMTPNDLLPTPEVVQLLKEEGIDIKYHRSRPVNDELIRQADLVLGFTAIHVQTCLRRVPESKPKTFLLKEYAGLGQSGDQIHDPMGSTMEIFKKYFTEIKQSLQKLVEHEFITTPPEPKEVVIAATVSKPRQTDEQDDVMSERRDESRRAKAKRPVKAEEQVEDNSEKDADAGGELEMQVAGKSPGKTLKTEKVAPAGKSASKSVTGKDAKASAKKAGDDKKRPAEPKGKVAKSAKSDKAVSSAKAGKAAEPSKTKKKPAKPAAKTADVAPARSKGSAKSVSASAATKKPKPKK